MLSTRTSLGRLCWVDVELGEQVSRNDAAGLAGSWTHSRWPRRGLGDVAPQGHAVRTLPILGTGTRCLRVRGYQAVPLHGCHDGGLEPSPASNLSTAVKGALGFSFDSGQNVALEISTGFQTGIDRLQVEGVPEGPHAAFRQPCSELCLHDRKLRRARTYWPLASGLWYVLRVCFG